MSEEINEFEGVLGSFPSAEALRAAYATSDNSHTAVRSLRNRLLLFGLLMLGLNLGLGVLSSLSPTLLPLCVKDFCASGGGGPAGGDVWLIQLLGALGGSLGEQHAALQQTRPSPQKEPSAAVVQPKRSRWGLQYWQALSGLISH